MNKSKIAYVTILFYLLFNLNLVSANYWAWIWVNNNTTTGAWIWWNNATTWAWMSSWIQSTNVDSEENDENNNDDNEEYVSSWDNIAVNSDIDDNLSFDKDSTIWSNSDITWDIKAKQNLKIDTNVDVKWNIIVDWDLTIWSNSTITWYVKVKWNLIIWVNADVIWNIYWYKTVWVLSNSETSWKIKVASIFVTWTNYTWKWKSYFFWSKKIWSNSSFSDNKEKWILWKVDPFLKIDLSENDFSKVKEIANKYDVEFTNVLLNIKKLKSSTELTESIKADIEAEKSKWKQLVEKIILDIDSYLEKEEFDINQVSNLKKEELSKIETLKVTSIWTNNTTTSSTAWTTTWIPTATTSWTFPVNNNTTANTTTTIDNQQITNNSNITWTSPVISAKNAKLKITIQTLLEKKMSAMSDIDKDKAYAWLISKIDTMLPQITKSSTKNMLIVLKETVQEMQDELSVWWSLDNLLKDIK